MSVFRFQPCIVQANRFLRALISQKSRICSKSSNVGFTKQARVASVPLIRQINSPLNPARFIYSASLGSYPNLFVRRRFFHTTGNNQKEDDQDRLIPKLIYIQNPLVWFSNKMDFRYLRTHWDPGFTEAEFSRGARQAISKITELISKNMLDSLKSLLTMNAFINLRKDVEILWADEMRRNIGLKPEDVQLIIPRKLYFRDLRSQRFCDIDMVFIGLKWVDNVRLGEPGLLFVDIFARFHRNYSEGIRPEWTVSFFRLRRFNAMPQKGKN